MKYTRLAAGLCIVFAISVCLNEYMTPPDDCAKIRAAITEGMENEHAEYVCDLTDAEKQCISNQDFDEIKPL